MSGSEKRYGIVVGVDGSAASNAAVFWAARDAALRNIPLTLVHMFNTFVPTVPADTDAERSWAMAGGRRAPGSRAGGQDRPGRRAGRSQASQ